MNRFCRAVLMNIKCLLLRLDLALSETIGNSHSNFIADEQSVCGEDTDIIIANSTNKVTTVIIDN